MTKKERQTAERRGNQSLCEEFPEWLKLSPASILGVSFITATSSIISVSHLARLLMLRKLSTLEGATWRARRSKKNSSKRYVGFSENMLYGTLERITAHGIYLRTTNCGKNLAMKLTNFCDALRAQRLFITWVPEDAQVCLGLKC